MKSKIVLFAFCLALLSGCGKKGLQMGAKQAGAEKR